MTLNDITIGDSSPLITYNTNIDRDASLRSHDFRVPSSYASGPASLHPTGILATMKSIPCGAEIVDVSSGSPSLVSAVPGFSVSSQVHIADRLIAAVTNHGQTFYSERTTLDPRVPLVLAYLSGATGAGLNVARPEHDGTSAPLTPPSLSRQGVTVAGILVASVSALLLLLLCCIIKRRRRRRRAAMLQTWNYDVEDGANRGTLFASHSSDVGHAKSSPAPSVSGASSSETVVSEEDNRAPTQPPRLLLRPEGAGREVQVQMQPGGDYSFEVAKSKSLKSKSKTVRFAGRNSRVQSMLPNPWESEEKPNNAAFEEILFQLPAIPAVAAATLSSPARPVNALNPAGLPGLPRTPRVFLNLELTSPISTNFAVRGSGVDDSQR
ncbi:hypothetical protein B0F90DRAFT_1816357 [Multifurca ochricompacta]|uniref:Uncharacterized protein n=1 Tax=Multifurca ochricompacta TaxID=376703 RepID=A0AAD4M607_9AGAM|nr:hypothetical protein B0F90DRAFT_1816357 [Multifurca ochricompacta]